METDQCTRARNHSRSLRREQCESPKRRRAEEPDRLTNLPQSLILLILSLLPTKLAVRTVVFSKRWRCFWPYVPVLDFRYRDSIEQCMHYSRMQPFVSSVNHVLIFYRSVKIGAFRVCMDYKRIYARDVDVWLLFATGKSAEEVELDFSDSDFVTYASSDDEDGLGRDDDMSCYVVPDFMFCNSSLVRLKLMNCEIKYGGAINWKSLRVLTLSGNGLSNDLIRSILSGSPSLEVLELLDCYEYDIVDINKHQKLRRFVINSYSKHFSPKKRIEIEIWAPFIKSLELSGMLRAYSVSLTNCSSLVEAKIDFEQDEDEIVLVENLREILGKVCRVRNLTVGHQCLQVLTHMIDHGASLQTNSWCRCLTLLTQLETCEIPGIAILLRSSPLLQTLHIDMTSEECNNYYRMESCKNGHSTLQKEFALKTLKTVTINGLVRWRRYHEHVIPVAKFLLKNAKVLEKMVICTKNAAKTQFDARSDAEELLDWALDLLSLPRASPKAVIGLSTRSHERSCFANDIN